MFTKPTLDKFLIFIGCVFSLQIWASNNTIVDLRTIRPISDYPISDYAIPDNSCYSHHESSDSGHIISNTNKMVSASLNRNCLSPYTHLTLHPQPVLNIIYSNDSTSNYFLWKLFSEKR